MKGTADLGLETRGREHLAVRLEADSSGSQSLNCSRFLMVRVQAFPYDVRGQCLAGPVGSPAPSDCQRPWGGIAGCTCNSERPSSPAALDACTPPDGFHTPAASGLVVREVPSVVVSGFK